MKFGDPIMDKVVDLHQKGERVPIIAGALQIPPYRVKAIINAHKEGGDLIQTVSRMKKSGMTDVDIARDVGKSKQYISRLTGTKRIPKGDTRVYTLKMDQGDWKKVMDKAEEFGLIVEDGVHAGRGSVRKLLEHIALGNITVLKDRSL